MKLLPMFRKAAKELGDEIHFGTVDCTTHVQICNKVCRGEITIASEETKKSCIISYMFCLFVSA